jgi:3-hydroxybutyryl-CoA dehydrogenase
MMTAPKTIGVAGLGFLGRGIAACLLSRGFSVIGFTIGEQSFRDARKHIQWAIEQLIERAGFAPAIREQWPAKYIEATSLSDFAKCDFVIESVTEDLQIKQNVFDELETWLGADVPIASNTSSMPITLLQKHRKYPQRFIGMHWAEPCHATRFLEVVRGEQTNDATVEATLNLGKLAGKDPALVKKDVEGFIVNRIGYAMYREAFWLLENDVADIETIDRSFRNAMSVWANIAGPFRWMDLSGLPAYAAVMKRLWPQLSCAKDVPAMMTQLVESGAKGISNGRGFYNYTPEEARQWEQRLSENVWRVRQMMSELFTESGS